MGVTGLLPMLSEIQEKGTLERYRGKTIAIDTFGWLHRGLISCAQELCLNQPTRKYITSVMKKVDMLRHFGVEPYFVFDGCSLPTKEATNLERKKNRDEARSRADTYLKQGQTKLAWKEFMKAACVTSQMVKSLITEFDKAKIKYIVAPYEADPQMVYLEKVGLCDGILSEDSDLLIFGCNRLITKLKDDGTCVEINRKNFNQVHKINNLPGYTLDHLHLVAILSGCDYTKGVAGVGIQTAFKLVKKYGSYDRVILALRADGKQISDTYLDEYVKANLAFKYQKVFDPRSMTLCPLTDYPHDFDFNHELLESCCGKEYNNELWKNICFGHIDPRTHEILVSREQSLLSLRSASVNYPRNVEKSKTTLEPIKKMNVLDYFSANTKTVVTTNNQCSVSCLTITSTSMQSTCLTHVPTSNKRSHQSPTSKKLQRITTTISERKGAISNFFIKKPDLKQVSLPASLPGRRLSFDEDSDFTDECSSPIKNGFISKNSSSDNMSQLTEDDEIKSSTKESSNIFLDSNSSFENDIEDILTKSQNMIQENPPQLDIESDLEELEESPVKILKPKADNINENSELFKFCHSLRINFLFDGLSSTHKNTVTTKAKQTRAPFSEVQVSKVDEKANKSSSGTCKPESHKVAKPVKTTNLAKFAFRG